MEPRLLEGQVKANDIWKANEKHTGDQERLKAIWEREVGELDDIDWQEAKHWVSQRRWPSKLVIG